MKYKIKKNDTLSSISKQFNIPIKSVIFANNIKNPNIITENSILIIPDETDNPFKISISTKSNILTLFSNNQKIKSYKVATGKPKTPSPTGLWKIIKKGLWGGVFGGFFMRLNVPTGIYGIHGTNKPWSVGKSVSNGCIRMYESDIKELYSILPINTSVEII